jgi:hypothetical protein
MGPIRFQRPRFRAVFAVKDGHGVRIGLLPASEADIERCSWIKPLRDGGGRRRCARIPLVWLKLSLSRVRPVRSEGAATHRWRRVQLGRRSARKAILTRALAAHTSAGRPGIASSRPHTRVTDDSPSVRTSIEAVAPAAATHTQMRRGFLTRRQEMSGWPCQRPTLLVTVERPSGDLEAGCRGPGRLCRRMNGRRRRPHAFRRCHLTAARSLWYK